jgi:hypothetical protein
MADAGSLALWGNGIKLVYPSTSLRIACPELDEGLRVNGLLPLVLSPSLPGHPERRRAAPKSKDAQDKLRCDSSGVEAYRQWIDITWNPYQAFKYLS